jgi:uncharacterized protein YceK
MKNLALISMLCLSSCGTIMNLCHEPRVYGGVRGDLEPEKVDLFSVPFLILDLPFSAVLDTALLPITIWFEIFRRKPRYVETPR